ncbi:MAG: glutamine phosphoribosylpyrophosphate amidotransferase [Acidobacteria bacterium]|nr:glutamine phosphoribosylpyrophosphate amidotransferase [Acidobacteriota bacterium]
MCGIAGYLHFSGEQAPPIGRVVLSMLEALGCRGPDSAGVALCGPRHADSLVLRVKLGDHADFAARGADVEAATARFQAGGFTRTGPYLRFTVPAAGELTDLTRAIEALSPDIEVVSAGTALEIVKQVGSPANLEATYQVSRFEGSHGIGHTRLSTESRVDLSHSQPFWGHGCADLAIVHNGHITNYHQLRRRYEQNGVRFYTENDSEIIGIYLARHLNQGKSLESGLRAMLRDMDGSFSCLAVTATELGFIKDPFAFKPLLVAETERFVAVATEEVAIRAAIAGDYTVREAQVREFKVWRR